MHQRPWFSLFIRCVFESSPLGSFFFSPRSLRQPLDYAPNSLELLTDLKLTWLLSQLSLTTPEISISFFFFFSQIGVFPLRFLLEHGLPFFLVPTLLFWRKILQVFLIRRLFTGLFRKPLESSGSALPFFSSLGISLHNFCVCIEYTWKARATCGWGMGRPRATNRVRDFPRTISFFLTVPLNTRSLLSLS